MVVVIAMNNPAYHPDAFETVGPVRTRSPTQAVWLKIWYCLYEEMDRFLIEDEYYLIADYAPLEYRPFYNLLHENHDDDLELRIAMYGVYRELTAIDLAEEGADFRSFLLEMLDEVTRWRYLGGPWHGEASFRAGVRLTVWKNGRLLAVIPVGRIIRPRTMWYDPPLIAEYRYS